MTSVMTVRGAVPADQLGLILPHEHIFIDLMREYRGDGLLHDEALAIEEVRAFAGAGGGTIVDVTSIGLGREPDKLRRVSEASGVHIIMGTGYYREPYLDRAAIDSQTVDELVEQMVAEIKSGIGSSGVRPGVIGEIACDRWLTAAEERCFRAAARAQRQTGLTITTHAARWPVGLPQLDVLEDEGVDPGRVIVGHCDLVPDPEYHRALALRGAWVQFDCIQGESEWDITARIAWIQALVREGFADRILLSHDVCLRSNLAAMGGSGYTYLLTGFRERLRAEGLATELIGRLMVDNPRRALAGEA